jgi:carbon storage regulator
MLVLTRKIGEVIVIGEHCDIRIVVLGTRGNNVRLGFEADPSIQINREEIYDRIKRERLYRTPEEEI